MYKDFTTGVSHKLYLGSTVTASILLVLAVMVTA